MCPQTWQIFWRLPECLTQTRQKPRSSPSVQLIATLRHLIRLALLLHISPIRGPRFGNRNRTFPTERWKEWHLRSLPGSQHDPRPRTVSPFPRHLFLWTCPACQQGSLTKAGVKRGLVLPGASISGIHPAGEEGEEGANAWRQLASHQLLCLPMQPH